MSSVFVVGSRGGFLMSFPTTAKPKPAAFRASKSRGHLIPVGVGIGIGLDSGWALFPVDGTVSTAVESPVHFLELFRGGGFSRFA